MFVLCTVAAVRHFVRSHLEDPQLSFYLCKCHLIFPLINHELISRRNASLQLLLSRLDVYMKPYICAFTPGQKIMIPAFLKVVYRFFQHFCHYNQYWVNKAHAYYYS